VIVSCVPATFVAVVCVAVMPSSLYRCVPILSVNS
jgi:hypothetical protein